MKISKLIFLSIFSILLLFTITTYVNYTQSEEVRENAEYLTVSSNIVRQSNQLQRNILNMERDVKAYSGTNETYLFQAFDSGAIENKAILDELSAAIPSTSAQGKKLREIGKLYKSWIDNITAQASLKTGPDSLATTWSTADFYTRKKEAERINRSLQQYFRELLNVEYATRAQRRQILEKSEQQTKVISVILTALSVIIGFVIAVLLARHISKRISVMVSMANSISNGNYNVHVIDKGNDELSELTRSLNHMAKMLTKNISLLQRKNKELDQFGYIVSHDLKAPLRGIDNLITWIAEDYGREIPAKAIEYLELIRGRIRRLESMIEGILNYSKIGRDVSKKEVVDVRELITEIVVGLPVKPGIDINVAESMPIIHTERLPLSQVLTNLISNAIKYHDKEKGSVKVDIKEQKDYYEFYVVDDGPGIARSYHERIFVIFQTLTARDTFESTGVGLAIVKKILDERGEQIRIESEPGRGTTFIFSWKKTDNEGY
jgi:signal transduction histidine kinase